MREDHAFFDIIAIPAPEAANRLVAADNLQPFADDLAASTSMAVLFRSTLGHTHVDIAHTLDAG